MVSKKLSLFILLAIFTLIQCDEASENQFVIHGEYLGKRDSELIFRYYDYESNLVLDTVPIIKGKFKVDGLINGPFFFMVFGNISSGQYNENNAVQFFIEPKTNKIKLVEDQFYNISVIGSEIQNESVKLDQKLESFHQEITDVREKRKEVELLGDQNKIDSLDREWSLILSKRIAFELNYSLNHGDSYLSAYIIDRYFPKIPFDSTRIYYNSLSSHVQKSYYGLSIAKKIEQRKEIKVGATAPGFRKIDHLGNPISLKDYRGKYVLLDFWASWCAPCRANNPTIRKLYADFHQSGFDIIGISSDDFSEKWKAAIEKDSIGHWRQIMIPRRGDIAVSYNLIQIPDYILIDPEGVIIGRKFKDKEFSINHISKALDSIFKPNLSLK
jgi:peroxiredoxin